MEAPVSEFGYTSASTRNGSTKSIRNMWWYWKDGRIFGEEEWQEIVYNREEWKKLLRLARNCRILHMPKEPMRAICVPDMIHSCVMSTIPRRD
jgi:hypothetical protein